MPPPPLPLPPAAATGDPLMPQDLAEAANSLHLRCMIEGKVYAKEYERRFRLRVQLFDDEGQPRNPEVKDSTCSNSVTHSA